MDNLLIEADSFEDLGGWKLGKPVSSAQTSLTIQAAGKWFVWVCFLILTGFSQLACATQYGWDYGLTRRCVRSIDPAGRNFFEDTTDGVAEHSWVVSVTSQKSFRNNPEPSGQAFPINAPGSPVKLTWTSAPGGGKQVTMTTDFINTAHPAGEPGYFVFYQFGDHRKHGGTQVWPEPWNLRLRFSACYREALPRGEDFGRTRWMAMMVAFWTDTNGNRKSRMIEVMPYISESWKHSKGAIDPARGIVNYIAGDTREYVAVLGDVFGYTSQSVDGTHDQAYDIDWGEVIDYLTSTPVGETLNHTHGQTYLTPPGPTPEPSVIGVTLATETHVRSSTTNSALSELTFHGFRVDSSRGTVRRGGPGNSIETPQYAADRNCLIGSLQRDAAKLDLPNQRHLSDTH
jgi:hypothetical protein